VLVGIARRHVSINPAADSSSAQCFQKLVFATAGDRAGGPALNIALLLPNATDACRGFFTVPDERLAGDS
jgi:hypothetical protein